ncbi:MAG: hypothetical protein NUV97_02030 [archaeon]|nr:hypothetical protein [archaeon]MCR4323730.1 hypothetical protein [Nanoarchaeota archaeon]
MPIYRYSCGDCGKIDDYLVTTPNKRQQPDECSGCGTSEIGAFKRIYEGVSFAAITSKTRIAPDGHTHITRNSKGGLEGMEGLGPGVNIREGINEDDVSQIDVAVVCERGHLQRGIRVAGPYFGEIKFHKD